MTSRLWKVDDGAEFRSLAAAASEAPQRYVAILERGRNNWSAYLPDLPGVVATGDSEEDVASKIRDAVAFHLDGMRDDGELIPEPQSHAIWILT